MSVAWLLLAALSVAIATLTGTLLIRTRRRRRRVREALHELRRPLQAVALSRESEREDPLLAQLRAALADLENAIWGRAEARCCDRVALDDLLDDAARRWGRRSVRVTPPPAAAVLDADRVRLGMALDNLIANGLEHGRGPVEVAARLSDRSLRLEVTNGRRRGILPLDGSIAAPKGLRDSRRGHGLRIARRQARSENGALEPPRSRADGSVVAAVELPRADSRRGT
jgi:signal transduction histidine kinase